ncbi:hypothetical protein ACGFIV_21825 [Sphaerisporangium sp. NPDC049003]|uniref:hypothetical protein n=1 Tax=Sphaerisporangium sp. NPDC049003 TaxID=3364517 RepID=UPI00371A7ACD
MTKAAGSSIVEDWATAPAGKAVAARTAATIGNDHMDKARPPGSEFTSWKHERESPCGVNLQKFRPQVATVARGDL